MLILLEIEAKITVNGGSARENEAKSRRCGTLPVERRTLRKQAYDSGATNANGRLVSITNGAAVDAVTGYDELGRITGSSQAIGGGPALTFAYTYNLADALVQTTYPSFGDSRGSRTVTNSYDVANRVVGVTGALGGTSTPYVAGTCSSGICYAASGAPGSYTYNNGVARSNSYNSLLQPTAMTDTLAGTTLLSLGYTFGATGANNGNPTQVAIGGSGAGAGFTQNYGYDKLNRLCAAGEAMGAVSITSCTAPTTGVNWAQNLGLDRYGNMWAPTASQAGVSGIPALGWMPTASGQINAANNQLAVSGLSYDTGGGNQTTFLGTSTTSPIQYDAENRQVQVVTATSTTYAYAYDGLGQRVSRSVGGATTEYVHDVFGNLAAEYNPPGSAACTTCYLSWDHLGSTRMVTDGSTTDGTTGQIVARHDYLPFGVEIPNGVAGRSGVWGVTDGLSPKFTGQDHDAETFLEFYQARYLAAGLGRFMSVDPGNAGADITDPQTWNMYGYVRNNPLVYLDPTGLDQCDPSDASCDSNDPGFPWPVWSGGGGSGGSGQNPPGVITPFQGQQQGPGAGVPPPLPPYTMSLDYWFSVIRLRLITLNAISDGLKALPGCDAPTSPGKVDYKAGVPSASPAISDLTICISACVGGPCRVTSTSDNHPLNDPHSRGQAVDGTIPGNAGKILQCGANCGAVFQQNEYQYPSPHATGGHYHFQIVPGRRGATGPKTAGCRYN